MQTQEQYTKALKRAHDEHCVIVGSSEMNGARAWSVENPKHESGWYTVRQAHAGKSFTCNCEAEHRSLFCKHAALVQESLNQPATPEHRTVGQMYADRLAMSLWS